jgi:signal transduction histidine kinase
MSTNRLNEPGAAAEGQREAELREALAERDERLAALAELAARVRHEINNPLTGLIGQTQLLLREDLSETARRRVLTIEQLANRIRDTVAELRTVQLNGGGGFAKSPAREGE